MSGKVSMPKVETPLDHLLRTLKVTAGCRFNAARRLESHDRRLTRLTAFASAYVIALTVLPYFMKLPSQTSDLYNLVTVGLSVVILVSSLLQYSSGEVVNSEQHHRSALEISEIRRLLLLKDGKVTDDELLEYTKQYNDVLQKYSINHDDIDFLQYQLERPEVFPWVDGKKRLAIRLRLSCNRNTPSVILFAMTAFMIWLVVWYGVAGHSLTAH